jgi:hypothetical protein
MFSVIDHVPLGLLKLRAPRVYQLNWDPPFAYQTFR